MKKPALAAALVVAIVAAVIVAVIFLNRTPEPKPTPSASGDTAVSNLAAPDSHRLQKAPDGSPVLVEFLDFECEACRAAYPFVEELRKDYKGKVTFVIRYFPLPGHKNSMTAALAVEAAAQQGKLQQMYSTMYERQTQWGEKQTSQASVFRGYAQELGLDMAAYDRAVASPATKARVEKDYKAGLEAGVEGPPTFFLDGEKVTVDSMEAFRSLIDEAVK